jgi:hypothetical protein
VSLISSARERSYHINLKEPLNAKMRPAFFYNTMKKLAPGQKKGSVLPLGHIRAKD